MNSNYADEIIFDDFSPYYDDYYFHEVEWNRELFINIVIDKEYINDKKYLNNISKVLTKVKKEEVDLYYRGINYLIENNLDLDEEDKERFEEDKDIFLYTGPDYLEVNIKMDSNGTGAITYTVMMYGSISIEFDKDGNFEKAFTDGH